MAAIETPTRAAPRSLTGAERAVARVLPSFGDILFLCILFGVVFGLQGRALGIDGDAGWSLRIGLQTLRSGLPRTEFLLASTYGHPTVYWEWLAQVCYAFAYQLGGLNGVVALAGLLVAATGAGLYAALRRRGAPLLLALALALAAIALTSITWTARAQLFSLPLTLWWSEQLWRYWRDGRARRLWAFPLVMALWANLHGGFLAGLILLATATAVAWLRPRARGGANPRHLTLALAASLLATLATPWGLALPAHILAYLRDPLVTQYTQEYQSPDFHSLYAQLFLLLVVAFAAALLYRARSAHPRFASSDAEATHPEPAPPRTGERLGERDPLLLAQAAIWTLLACVSARFVPIWALVVLPLLADVLAGCRRQTTVSTLDTLPPRSSVPSVSSAVKSEWRVPMLAPLTPLAIRVARLSTRLEVTDALVGRGVWSALGLAGVAVLVLRGGALPGSPTPVLRATFDSSAFPVAAAQRLHASGLPLGQGLTTYEWGGYLDFALPEYHVFVDSRSDAYSQRLLQDYATVIAVAPGWRDVLRRYSIRWALLPAGSPLAQMLALDTAWRCAPADTTGVAALCVAVPGP